MQAEYTSHTTALQAAKYIRGPQVLRVDILRRAPNRYTLSILWDDLTGSPVRDYFLGWHVNYGHNTKGA